MPDYELVNGKLKVLTQERKAEYAKEFEKIRNKKSTEDEIKDLKRQNAQLQEQIDALISGRTQ